MVRDLVQRSLEQRRRVRPPRCTFCGKDERRVEKLIAGPGVYICDECVALCNEIIDKERSC